MPNNLFHALQDAVKDSQQKRFLSSPSGFSLSYGDFFALAARYATALQSHGIEKGDRVLAKTAKSIHSLALYVSPPARSSIHSRQPFMLRRGNELPHQRCRPSDDYFRS